MANQFDRWDKEFNTEEIAKGVAEAAEHGTGEFKEVPHGDYEVEINKMELKASKKGSPMVSIWFKILEGEYKGSLIFFNQVVTEGFQIHIVNELLRKMVSEMTDDRYAEEIDRVKEKFSYNKYGNLIMDIFEAIDGSYEYALSYKKGKKDFSTYEITDIFVLD